MVAATYSSHLVWKKLACFFICVVFWVFLPGAFAATKNVIHIKFTPQSSTLRMVLDISSPVQYQVQQSKQQQLLLTISDSHLRFPLPALPPNNLVTDYQSKQQGKDLQFRFTSNKNIENKIYLLPPGEGYGDRLVVELSEAALPTPTKETAKQPVAADETKSIKEKKSEKAKSIPVSPAAPSVVTAVSKPPPAHTKVIVIDPGHGGKDPGAVGPGGYQEKNVVLAISKILQEILHKQGYQAVLTRDRDFFIPLRQRLAIARRYKPDLFVAVHADAAYSGSTATGASVFALSERGATSEGARWLAIKENQSELVDGVFVDKDPMLRSVLLDLSQTHTIGVSLDMGREILQQLSKVTHLHYAGVEQAAFVVLKSPDIPSLLIETGYITNTKQEQQLSSPAYQRQLALNIAQGIKSYFASHPQ